MDALLRDTDPDVDRVLAAGQLAGAGETHAAHLILASLVYIGQQVETDFGRMCTLLEELDDLTMRVQLCHDDPRAYVDLYEDDRPHVTYADYSEWMCAELDADITQVTADIRMLARRIAEHADRLAVAS